MAGQLWARPFNVTTVRGEVYHGVEFPSGRVVLDHQVDGLVAAAVSLDVLLAAPDMNGAVVERPEERSH